VNGYLRLKLARILLGIPDADGFWQSLNGIQFAVVLCGGNVGSAMFAGYTVVGHSYHSPNAYSCITINPNTSATTITMAIAMATACISVILSPR